MKKTYVTAAIAGAMLISVASANAQVYENSDTGLSTMYSPEPKFIQMEEQDLPNEVRLAVDRDYNGATFSEIYSSEKDGETTYKLVLNMQDGQSKELFADNRGNWIEKKEK